MPREEFRGRYTSIYFDTVEEKQFWEDFARDRGTTLSNLIFEALAFLRDKESSKPRPDLIKENDALKTELQQVKHELKLKTELLQRYESEVYKARYADFRAVDPEGTEPRRYDLDLIKLLRTGKTFDGNEILANLYIDSKDREASRLVWNQLEALQRHGLVIENSNGWRWQR